MRHSSAFRELETPARAATAVLLPLDHPAATRQVSALAQDLRYILADLLQRPGQTMHNRPRLAGRTAGMEENVSRALSLELNQVNIKATTNEGLDAIGRGEAIAALAVAGLRDMPTRL